MKQPRFISQLTLSCFQKEPWKRDTLETEMLTSGLRVVARGTPHVRQVRCVSGATFDRRRMVARSQWRPNGEEDPDSFVFPNESLGNQYSLNWAVNKYQITPAGKAYRNLHTRGLQMLSSGKTDKQRTVIAESKAPASHDTFYLKPAADELSPSVPENAKTVTFEQFKLLFRDVRKHLSSVDQLFVHDGAVGSSAASDVKARVFLDDANQALYLKHMLNKVSFRAPLNYEEDIQVYVASSLSGMNLTAVDVESKTVLVIGNSSTAAVRDAILSLSSAVLKEKKVEVLPAHVVVDGGKSALVFAEDAAAPEGLDHYSASHTLWGEDGVSRAFNGISHSRAANSGSRGDLVETDGKKETLTRSLANGHGSSVAHPEVAVFVGVDPAPFKSFLDEKKLKTVKVKAGGNVAKDIKAALGSK